MTTVLLFAKLRCRHCIALQAVRALLLGRRPGLHLVHVGPEQQLLEEAGGVADVVARDHRLAACEASAPALREAQLPCALEQVECSRVDG